MPLRLCASTVCHGTCGGATVLLTFGMISAFTCSGDVFWGASVMCFNMMCHRASPSELFLTWMHRARVWFIAVVFPAMYLQIVQPFKRLLMSREHSYNLLAHSTTKCARAFPKRKETLKYEDPVLTLLHVSQTFPLCLLERCSP
jgi:hypothetical protein